MLGLLQKSDDIHAEQEDDHAYIRKLQLDSAGLKGAAASLSELAL